MNRKRWLNQRRKCEKAQPRIINLTGNGGKKISTSTVFEADATVYAQWTANKIFTVTFDPCGGELDGATTATTQPNGKLLALPGATRTGYQFNGWYTEAEGGEKITFSTVFEADATIYANWTENKIFTVTFDVQGGELAGDTTATTRADGRLLTLPEAMRAGYVFEGWYSEAEGGEEITTSTVFDGNTTIYANWTVNKAFTITFDPCGGEVLGETTATTQATTGKLEALPVAVRAGYDFEGWFTTYEGGEKITENYEFESDTTIYAQWTINKIFTVTFDVQGGELEGDSTAQTSKDGTLSVLPKPTRAGYVFDGWYTLSEGGVKITFSTVFETAATVYAHWYAEKIYTITFNANGGELEGNATATTQPTGKLATFPRAAREGYVLNGWYTAAEGGNKVTAATVFEGDATVYAHWDKRGYEITFNLNGGNYYVVNGDKISGGVGYYLRTQPDGLLSSMPEATKSGYDFKGWFTARLGGDKVTKATVFEADATVYAHWEEKQITTEQYPYNIPEIQRIAFGNNNVSALANGDKVIFVFDYNGMEYEYRFDPKYPYGGIYYIPFTAGEIKLVPCYYDQVPYSEYEITFTEDADGILEIILKDKSGNEYEPDQIGMQYRIVFNDDGTYTFDYYFDNEDYEMSDLKGCDENGEELPSEDYDSEMSERSGTIVFDPYTMRYVKIIVKEKSQPKHEDDIANDET